MGHAVWVRLCHWLIAITVLVLGGSGIMILMAHPRLYWGDVGNDLTQAWIELPLGRNYHHGGWGPGLRFADAPAAISRARTYEIFNQDGWARSLHFLTAWIFAAALLAYLALGLATRHLTRDLSPRADDLRLSRLSAELKAYLRLPLPRAPGGPPYKPLQKIAYAAVAMLALPLMVLSGLGMSPAVAVAWPWIQGMFGGSQSARSVHFLILCILTIFLVAHLIMAALTGFGRQIRAMTLGLRHED
jgi:thiosulfate reductase cytochrome b subunit